MYKKYNIDFILGIDSHYIYEKDAELRDIFLRSKDINYPDYLAKLFPDDKKDLVRTITF